MWKNRVLGRKSQKEVIDDLKLINIEVDGE